jgi:hypothetical protein
MDTIRGDSMAIGRNWVDADERFEIRSAAIEEQSGGQDRWAYQLLLSTPPD